jgi:signal transduction histidine kinase/ligand-binding sensor domain-containing protein
MFCRPFARVVWLGLVLAGWVAAAAPLAERFEAGPFRVRRWTTNDGLPQHRIACIKQTRDGYLWLGTWMGLVRFDGVTFTVFDKFNTLELTNDTINALAEDAEGTLWIGTKGGLVSYRNHRFARQRTADGLLDQGIQRVAACGDGGVWLQAGSGVVRLRGADQTLVHGLESGGHAEIVSLQASNEGWLNVFLENGWLVLSPSGQERRTNFVVGPGSRILAGSLAREHEFALAGTAEGLCRLEAGGSMTMQGPPGPKQVDLVYQDRTAAVWVNAHPGGLHRWDGERWEPFDVGQGATVCLEEDPQGNLWLGNDLGLAQLQRLPVRSYTGGDGLANDNVLSVCEGTDGAIWVGTDHGLSCIRNGRVLPAPRNEPVKEYRVLSVWPNAQGGVFVAKPGYGLLEYQAGQFTMRAQSYMLPGQPNALYGDRSGRLWVGADGGAVAFRPGSFANPCERIPKTTLRDVRSFLEDRDGTLWFGSKGQGLARMRDGKCTLFTQRDGLSDNDVWSIHQDTGGTLWLGTGHGLTRCRDGKLFAFGRREGLLEDTINCVLEDDTAHLWLSGLQGIYRVARAQLDAVAEGRASTVRCLAIGTTDGMDNAETNGGENQPAGWKARNGRLWFPTVRGVVEVEPTSPALDETRPRVVIEQVKADDQILGEDLVQSPTTTGSSPASEADSNGVGPKPHGPPPRPRHQLSTGLAHVVEFKYNTISFVAPERVRFRYRLKGADTDWREETRQRSASYFNLRPGDYVFEVMAADHHNLWSLSPVVFPFSLEPHFWQTWTFYVLCAAALVGLAAAVQGYRLRWQHRLLKLEEQRALANERARIARDLHDDLGTALTGLALELDVVGREARSASPVAERLADTAQRTRELAERMREVVWTVNPSCDTVSSLASFLEQQVSQFLRVDGLRMHLDFPEDIPELPLGAEPRHQLALAVREALTNVVRHARASEVWVGLALEEKDALPAGAAATATGGAAHQMVVVRIKDNGKGFAGGVKDGHGLGNMRERLERVGGTFTHTSAQGSGTTITLRLPL